MAAQIIESLSSGNVLEVKNNDTIVFAVDTESSITLTSKTGWADPTGTIDRTTFDTAAVTLPELAERVYGLIADLKSVGILSA